MDKPSIAPLISGNALTELLGSERAIRKPISEDLIYEKTCTMMYGDAGIGKSTIIAQMIMELASGLPVFGYFNTVKPVKVVYCQSERNIIEIVERINKLKEVIPYNQDNIFITDEYQKLNMSNINHASVMVECLKRDCPDVSVIFFDPIYAMVQSGLSSETGGLAFTTAMKMIQHEMESAIWLSHHPTKDTYHDGKLVNKKDPYYGSAWLRAHITASYYVKQTKEGIIFDKTKDNYGILASSIDIEYNQENQLCSVKGERMLSTDKIKRFLRAKSINNDTFYFEEIRVGTGLCIRTIREGLLHSSIKPYLKVVNSYKNKDLYKFKEPF